jgi:hypothetical protein
MVDGIAPPQRSRSRPDVIAITSSCDVNDKGNRRAKVMPGLSGAFHCGPRNLSAGSQCLCPYVGSCFLGSGQEPVVRGMGSRAANWISTCRRGMHSCRSNRSVLAVRE